MGAADSFALHLSWTTAVSLDWPFGISALSLAWNSAMQHEWQLLSMVPVMAVMT